MVNVHGNTSLVNVLVSDERNANGNGSGIDVTDFHGIGAMVLNSKNQSGTTPTLDVTFEHSDDDSTYVAVPAAALPGGDFTQHTTGNSFQKIAFNFDVVKKYVREKHVVGGTTPVYRFGVVALAEKQYKS